MWQYIIARRVCPSGNTSNCTYTRALMIACILDGIPVNVGHYNIRELKHKEDTIRSTQIGKAQDLSIEKQNQNGEKKTKNMGYHPSFVDEEGITKACGCPLLPLKSHINEFASDTEQDTLLDIVDESITFFRANIFFRNFDIKSSTDKLLIYLTLYINMALKRLEGCRTLAEGKRSIFNLGLENIVIPGEPGFPFPGLFASPKSQQEAEQFRNYLKQLREETSERLLNVAYRPNGTPNKWWLAFSKRSFLSFRSIVPTQDIEINASTEE
ncbi:actin-related protein 2/3 complex subunit 3-like [Lycium barbarum]|uniref:actin-related protein 2/3 complex subunit 3-like n=1 Tax=Lycium barbarum TaxID=112863 RepID=UPI00293F40AE|nr:actin-related protein 2/3 complex subunit 3-like [Lycium barbarum]